jgi:hypothetical protein
MRSPKHWESLRMNKWGIAESRNALRQMRKASNVVLIFCSRINLGRSKNKKKTRNIVWKLYYLFMISLCSICIYWCPEYAVFHSSVDQQNSILCVPVQRDLLI